MFDINALLRDNIRKLIPYSSARSEFKGQADTWLDANENAYGSPLDTEYNRYPDPLQKQLKEKISSIKGVAPDSIFIGNGSDEAIDLLFRAFCRPGIDNVVVLPPTYGMYEVSANINDVEIRKAPLTTTFQPNLDLMQEVVDENTKMIFFCSPNNPSGNGIDREAIEVVLNNFDGLVIVDEAYINYSRRKSFIPDLADYPNLVVLQTLSKAWGLAGLRVGMAFAWRDVIDVLNKIKPPYNINAATQTLALEALQNIEQVNDWIKNIVRERDAVAKALTTFSFVQTVYPSDANFLLVKVDDPKSLYDFLCAAGVVVRDRSRVAGCEGCLRITIGTTSENEKLMQTLQNFNG